MGEISDGERSDLYEGNDSGDNSDSQETQPLIGQDAPIATTSIKREEGDSMDQLTQEFARQVEIIRQHARN